MLLISSVVFARMSWAMNCWASVTDESDGGKFQNFWKCVVVSVRVAETLEVHYTYDNLSCCILFFRHRALTMWWKHFVLLSPRMFYWMWNLCFQISSYLGVDCDSRLTCVEGPHIDQSLGQVSCHNAIKMLFPLLTCVIHDYCHHRQSASSVVNIYVTE